MATLVPFPDSNNSSASGNAILSKQPPSLTRLSAPSQVSWQTAYWTLIPLAVNTMAQPSGRILSLPAKYRTYLRCSPLICAADSLTIFIHLIFYFTAFSFKDAIRLLIRQRFGDGEEDEGEGSDEKDEERNEEGIQAIEKFTFVRWLFFILGTVGPGIKLMAMEGVPCTKAWGAMFLVSFLVVEVLVILSWRYMPCEHQDLLPGSPGTDTDLRIRVKLKKIDGRVLYYSVLCYALVFIWAVCDIYDALLPTDSVENPLPRAPFQIVFSICSMVTGFIILTFSLALLLLIIWPRPIAHLDGPPCNGPLTHIIVGEILFRFQFGFILAISAFLLFKLPMFFVIGLIVWALLLVLVLPSLIIILYLVFIADLYPRFSRSVFITWESSTEKREKWEKKRKWVREARPDLTFPCFAMFLYSTILSVVWYWYRYNPEGTVNKGWTGVFG